MSAREELPDGVDRVVGKPVTGEDLRAAIQAVLAPAAPRLSSTMSSP
jgi:hypothetical protein